MKKLKRKIIKLGLKTFNLLPNTIHDGIVRKFLFSVDLPDVEYKKNIQFKIAETKEEVEAALKLIQSCYQETNLTTETKQKIRINKYKLLPTTTIFIATYKGEVIGTCSQVMDTNLGLPIDHFMDIQHLRDKGRRISEITGLAVRKDWRSHSKGVFFPLVCYSVLYSKEVIGSQDIIICTRASARKFYRAIFGFKPVSKKVDTHDGVNGQPSFAQILKVDSLGEDLYKLYGNKSKIQKNCFKVLATFPWRSTCDFKKTKFQFLKNRSFNLDTINYFFNEQSDVFKTLTTEDKTFLRSLYNETGYQNIISDSPMAFNKLRTSPRFYVNMNLYTGQKGKIKSFKVFQISYNGLCLQGTGLPEEIKGEIYLNEKVKCQITAKKVWSSTNRSGYQFTYIDSLIWNTVFSWVDEQNRINLVGQSFQEKTKELVS